MLLSRQLVRSTRVWRTAPMLLLGASLLGLTPAATSVPSRPVGGGVDDRTAAQAAPATAYGQLPMSFEVNQGQADPAVDFVAHAQGYALALNAREAVLSLHKNAAKQTGVDVEMPEPANVLHVQLNGADPRAPLVAQDLLPGTANYFIGNDPAQWHSAIPTYARVGYRTIYPGVDLVYYGHQGQLENDFVVAPGADPSRIRLAFDGADGFDVDATGALVIHAAGGDVRLQAPVIYQEGSDRQAVSGTYVLTDVAEVGFAVGAYDAAKPLIIDPVLVYSTFLGGLGDASGEGDLARGIAVDAAGNAYVAGRTGSSDFPTTPGALQGTLGGSPDVFVTKLNATGTALVYSTFLGGSGFEDGLGIALDPAGNAYVTGSTGSSDFPTTPGAFQRTSHGADAFVTELNATGTALVYSTLLGRGSESRSIAVDAAGNAYVTGTTLFADFPTTPGAFQRTLRGFPAAFVTKLNATGSALVYSTLLGGTFGEESGFGIALDAAGNAYVTGDAGSDADFPTTPGAFQRTFHGPDAFVTKLNTTGTALVYSTFLGGSEFDVSSGVAVDGAGNAYVTGFTGSSDFPTTPGAFQRDYHGPNAFVTKLNATGSALVYSTLLGGTTETETGSSRVAVDADGNAYIAGGTFSSDFPTTPGAFQRTLRGASDVFVTKLNPTGASLVFSTLLGGSSSSQSEATLTLSNPALPGTPLPHLAIAVDRAGRAYVAGFTDSADFPVTPGAVQRTLAGGGDAFVTRIEPGPPGCTVAAVLAGPPTQLRVQVHADRGLATLTVTQAANVSVDLPAFAPGTSDTLLVTGTKLDQTARASLTLRATDVTGASTECDPSLVAVGRAPGDSPVQVIHHVARAESHVTITNGTPGVQSLRLLVNGHTFQVSGLHNGEKRMLDVSAAMRKGSDNTILVVAHGPKDSSAVVLVSDS